MTRKYSATASGTPDLFGLATTSTPEAVDTDYDVKDSSSGSFTVTSPSLSAEVFFLGTHSSERVTQLDLEFLVTVKDIQIEFSNSGGKVDKVLIGQKVEAKLAADYDPGPLVWTKPDDSFKSYVASLSSATLNTLQPADLGANPLVFYFTGEANKTVTVQCTAKFNGKSATIAAPIDYVVPTAFFNASITSQDVIVKEYPLVFGIAGLYLRTKGGTSTKPAAIYFNVNLATPYPFYNQGDGDFQFVQLVKMQRFKTKDDDTEEPASGNSTDFRVDKAYPYMPSSTANVGATAPPVTAEDTPGTTVKDSFGVEYKKVEVRSELFKMYLMYRPPGTSSQWVPLYRADWNWSGNATRPTGGWINFDPTQSVGSIKTAEVGIKESIHPVWTAPNL